MPTVETNGGNLGYHACQAIMLRHGPGWIKAGSKETYMLCVRLLVGLSQGATRGCIRVAVLNWRCAKRAHAIVTVEVCGSGLGRLKQTKKSV